MEKEKIIIAVLFVLLSISLVNAETVGISEKGVEYDNQILENFDNSYFKNETFKEVLWIPITVDVKDFSNVIISKDDFVEIQAVKDNERWNIFRNTSYSILETLSENEFQLKRKSEWGRSFSGNITKEGFEKLLKNTLVKKIYAKKEIYVSLGESTLLINADDAWSSGYDGTGQTVCIIDTGVNYSHSDLGGCLGGGCKVKSGYDYVNSDSNPMDDHSHGTHVTGIVASEDSTYKGIAPEADIVALKAGNGEGAFSEQDVKDSLSWCYNNRNTYNISVVTMSFGGPNGLGECGEDYADSEISDLYNAGIPVIAASGNNDDESEIAYPACNSQVLSVGATYDSGEGIQEVDWCDLQWGGTLVGGVCFEGIIPRFAFSCTDYPKEDEIACWSNRGSLLDLLAPGAFVDSTNIEGGFSVSYGTSAAAPMVAGAVALLFQKDPTLAPTEIKDLLQITGVNVGSWKRIDVEAALNLLPDPCDCGSWSSGSCGAGSCNSEQKQWTRSCTPSACAAESKCVYDEGCEEEDPPSGSAESCSEPGYEGCVKGYYGDVNTSIAINQYTSVNNIQWGAVNDSYDPYVIGNYTFGWKGVVAEKVYYGIDDPNTACLDGEGYCQDGCDGGEEVSNTDIRVTVTAPEIAHREEILSYADSEDYCSWTWFYEKYPSYLGVNNIFVLNCFNDTDCSASEYCNKNSTWSNWDCVNDKSNGQSCIRGTQCSSGYCDNDGVGLSDDDWCFTPFNTFFDGQETSYCEYSTNTGSQYCDERQAGTDLNVCYGLPYREEECNSTCDKADVTSIFECNDANCSCSEPLCDGLTTSNNITTCSSGETYFADVCTAVASGQDRDDNICRSSVFFANCTADLKCNGIVNGTGDCDSSCVYNYPPQYANILEYPTDPTINFSGAIYRFNATWTDDGTIDTVTLEFNGVNYTDVSQNGNVFGREFSNLNAGIYNYQWYANDTTGKTNETSALTYTINESSSEFEMRNSTNSLQVFFGDLGHLVLRKTLEQSSSYQSTINDLFVIENNGEEVLIVSENGTMYIDGTLHETQGALSTSESSNDFIIETPSELVAVVNETGHLFLKQNLIENGNPLR